MLVAKRNPMGCWTKSTDELQIYRDCKVC